MTNRYFVPTSLVQSVPYEPWGQVASLAKQLKIEALANPIIRVAGTFLVVRPLCIPRTQLLNSSQAIGAKKNPGQIKTIKGQIDSQSKSWSIVSCNWLSTELPFSRTEKA